MPIAVDPPRRSVNIDLREATPGDLLRCILANDAFLYLRLSANGLAGYGAWFELDPDFPLPTSIGEAIGWQYAASPGWLVTVSASPCAQDVLPDIDSVLVIHDPWGHKWALPSRVKYITPFTEGARAGELALARTRVKTP